MFPGYVIFLIVLLIFLLILRKIFLSLFDFDFTIDFNYEKKKRKFKVFDTDPNNKVIYLHDKCKNGVYTKPSKELIDHVNYVEKRSENVLILLPHDTNSITPRFFELLFRDSIQKLGEEKFKKKFTFKSTNDYTIGSSLTEGIIRATR